MCHAMTFFNSRSENTFIFDDDIVIKKTIQNVNVVPRSTMNTNGETEN